MSVPSERKHVSLIPDQLVQRAEGAAPASNPIVSVDVDYKATNAQAAAVAFDHWQASASKEEIVVPIDSITPYVPGQFYKRELPCILAALKALTCQPQLVIVDGYVWLTSDSDPGLGAHLFTALDNKIPVIGVAKTSFRGATAAVPIRRGNSHSPLFITSVGIDNAAAAKHIQQMHGSYRIPTLLKLADSLCRDWKSSTSGGLG